MLQLGVGLQALQPLRNFGGVVLAQGVLGRGQHGLHFVNQRLRQLRGQPGGNVVGVVELVGHPHDLGIFAASHGDHALGQQAANGRGADPFGNFFQRGVERALVVVAQREDVHQLRGGGCGIPLLQLFAHKGE